MTVERFRHLEIEIDSCCDANCKGCDRFIDVAPGPSMEPAQIEFFVRECLDLQWQWDRIHILGGEPTLHPRFREMIAPLIRYRSAFPDVKLRLVTNGMGHLQEHRAWLTEQTIEICVESKGIGKLETYFHNMWLAPIDAGPEDVPPCAVFGIAACGIGLSRHGYYLCGAAAGIARVISADVAVRRLADLTVERALGQAKVLCKLCGHAETAARGLICQTGPIMGPFWAAAIAKFREPHPDLPLYGDPPVQGSGS